MVCRITTQDWTLDSLLGKSKNFQLVHRISAVGATHAQIEKVIREFEIKGLPLIICDFHQLPGWDKNLLSEAWLHDHYGGTEMPIRDVHTCVDQIVTVKQYLEYASETPPYATEDEQNRFYGKDAVCPLEWTEWLTQSDGVIPPYIFPHGEGDLFRHMHDSERPETLMTYLGIGDTYTPCHKDLCASVGQNLMTYTAPDSSAFWFFTPSESSLLVSQHFHTVVLAELDFESTTLSPKDFSKFPCPVYICEQRLGDLVIVPRKSCHQVVNHGGLTIKTSWSRMTPSSMEEAIREECLIYRRVCRPEVYRAKLLLYRSIQALSNNLQNAQDAGLPKGSYNVMKTQRDLRDLLGIFDEVLASEHAENVQDELPFSDTDDHITCDFCHADIFSAFFECDRSCGEEEDPDPQGHSLCPTCYVEGRGCCSDIVMRAVRHPRLPFTTMLLQRNAAASEINSLEGHPTVPLRDITWLTNQQYNRILRAAVHLQALRLSSAASQNRRCSAFSSGHPRPAHDVDAINWIRCLKCHRAHCIKHSLFGWKIYATQAIWGSHLDPQHFHDSHMVITDIFRESYGQIVLSSEPQQISLTGEHSPELRLVVAIVLFSYCEIRPGLTRGWYDRTELDPVVKEPVIRTSRRKSNGRSGQQVPTEDLYDSDTALIKIRRPPAKRRPRASAPGKAPSSKRIKIERMKVLSPLPSEESPLADQDQSSSSDDALADITPSEIVTPLKRNGSTPIRTSQKSRQGRGRASSPIHISEESSGEPDEIDGLPEMVYDPPNQSSRSSPAFETPMPGENGQRTVSHGEIKTAANAVVEAWNAEREQPTVDRQLAAGAALRNLLTLNGIGEEDLSTKLMLYFPQPNRPTPHTSAQRSGAIPQTPRRH